MFTFNLFIRSICQLCDFVTVYHLCELHFQSHSKEINKLSTAHIDDSDQSWHLPSQINCRATFTGLLWAYDGFQRTMKTLFRLGDVKAF